MPSIEPSRAVIVIILLFATGLKIGCSPGLQTSKTDEPQAVETSAKDEPSAPSSFASSKTNDLGRLAKLWQERTRENSVSEYPIGPGDVVEISVPAIEELRSRVVRVSADGTIALPFLGKIEVTGVTEEELRLKLLERLGKYMYNPRVSLFVKEYRSRQVAVLGAVFKPGLYSPTTGADTILDMISQAGGITSGADPRLYFIPAEPGDTGQAQQIASTLPKSLLQQDPTPLILKRTDPILIDMNDLAIGGHQQYLSLSVRPGDIIMVPGGGQVLVEGWVEKPGAYNVTPGLTVSGAVVAAGGLLYPADDTTVKVIRSERGGKRSLVTADLGKIKSGKSPDVSLQGGDIVEVTAVTSRLIPYGLYRFFTTIVNVGVGGSIPITGS
jgi:polysaccharide biosynthesis/export protein